MKSKIQNSLIKSVISSKYFRLVFPLFLLALPWSITSNAQKMSEHFYSRDSPDNRCIANLKVISNLIKIYLHQTAQVAGFPRKLDTIRYATHKRSHFVCPNDKTINLTVNTTAFQTSYEIVSDPLNPKMSGVSPNKIAIVAEKSAYHDGKRFVLFYSGDVRAFDEKEFEKLKARSFIDE